MAHGLCKCSCCKNTVNFILFSNIQNCFNNSNADKRYLKKLFKFIVLFPLFLALSMGLSLHNSIAVIQGFIGKLELCNAFSELNDPIDQRGRFEDQLRQREANDDGVAC